MKCFLLLALFSLSAGLPLQGLRGNDFELFNNLTKKLRRPSDLIFGGDHAKQGQWPWQAFLIMTNFEGGTYICGGSLISKKHVLTAAHCTETLDLRSPSIVMFGVVDVESAWNTPGAQLKKIRSFVEKDGYDGNSSALYDDIAIITLDSEVKITKDVQIVKIKKDDEKIIATPKDTVSGFGTYMFKDGVPVTSDTLRYVEVDHIDHEWCVKRWARVTRNRVQVWNKQICAGSNRKGAGPGDSGGPIQVNVDGEWFQIGLTSFGVDAYPQIMFQDDYPAVYTRVSAYCDFIEQQTQNAFHCL